MRHSKAAEHSTRHALLLVHVVLITLNLILLSQYSLGMKSYAVISVLFLILFVIGLYWKKANDYKRRLHSQLDVLPCGILLVDDEMQIKEVNEYALGLFQYEELEIVGMKLSAILHYGNNIFHHKSDAGIGESRVLKIDGIKKDGQIFPGEVQVDSIDAKKIVYSVSIRDLSEIKKSEEKLIFSNQEQEKQNWIKTQMAFLFKIGQSNEPLNQMGARFISRVCNVLDAGMGVLYFRNHMDQIHEEDQEAIYSVFGTYAYSDLNIFRQSIRPGEGLVGQCVLDKKVLSLNDIANEYFNVLSGLGRQKPSGITCIPVIYQDMVLAVIEVATLKEFNDNQTLLIENIMMDMGPIISSALERQRVHFLLETTQEKSTALKEQSESLTNANDELKKKAQLLQESEIELQEKSRALQITNEELEKSFRYKSEFMANMSHELRTPLNSMLLLSKMLAENDTNNLTPEQIEMAQIINRGGEDLLALINDILDLSKIEADKMIAEDEKISLSVFVEKVKNQFKIVAEQKGVSYIEDYADDVPTAFYSDFMRLEQIIRNLLSNAIKFTDQGHVAFKVFLEKRARDTQFLSVKGLPLLVFQVLDTGIGIKRNKIKDIFGAFQQADGAINRVYGGTGLGLAISKKLARLLGGDITVESEYGKGSIFSLYIPLRLEKMNVVEEEVKSDSGDVDKTFEVVNKDALKNNGLAGKTIIMIDQDIKRMLNFRKQFKEVGVQLYIADDLLMAKEKLSDLKIVHCIIINMANLKFDAESLKDYLRQSLKHHPKLKRLAIGDSGNSSVSKEELEESGVEGFVHERFSFNDLCKEIGALLQ